MKSSKMDTASLELIGETIVQVFTLWMEFMLPEVDWGVHDSTFFLYLVHIDHDTKPKDFFTQGLWGGLPQRTPSTHLMEYLKDSFDTGQIEDEFSNSKSI